MTITKEQIDQIFEEAEKPEDYLISFIHLSVSKEDFQKAVNVGFTLVGSGLYEYLYKKGLEFDRKYYDENGIPAFPGGLLLNYGPSFDPSLEPWDLTPPVLS